MMAGWAALLPVDVARGIISASLFSLIQSKSCLCRALFFCFCFYPHSTPFEPYSASSTPFFFPCPHPTPLPIIYPCLFSNPCMISPSGFIEPQPIPVSLFLLSFLNKKEIPEDIK
jgi:hypothetical protein